VVVDLEEIPLERRAPLRDLVPMPDGLDVDAKSATATVHAEINLQERSVSGRASLKAPELRVRTGDEVLAGPLDVEVATTARNSVVDLAGSSLSFRASPAGGKGDNDPWWVRVRAHEAKLDLKGPSPRIRALFTGNAKDASPVSAFLAKVTPLPRWLIDAVPTKDLQLQGEILARPSALEVRSVQARSDGSRVDFEFERLAYWKEWAVLVQAGSVHAGVRAGDGGTEAVLFNAVPWFDAQTAAFRANAARFH
jgi:hypothetical protein